MISGKLFFGINYPYDQTRKNPLESACVFMTWDSGLKKYIYLFPISKLKEVEALIGRGVDLPERASFVEKNIHVPKWKGDDMIEIVTYPTEYNVVEHRKGRPLKWSTTKAHVDKVWKVILKQRLNKKVKTRTVAKNVCKYLRITRFNKENGEFSWVFIFAFIMWILLIELILVPVLVS